jgi:hypothetical protein
MQLKHLIIFPFLIISISLLGQNRIQLGFDAGLIMCFTHFNLETDIVTDNQDIYREGSLNDPNYRFGFKSKFQVNDKHSLLTGIDYIHKNFGIEYSNIMDVVSIDFSIYGATHNFEIPFTYNYAIAQIKNPSFTISGIIGGSFLLTKKDYTTFYNHNTDFEIIQTSIDHDNSWKENYSLKLGVISSSYHPKVGHYEFGLDYSFDILSIHKEIIELRNDQNTQYADFDIRVSYLSLFLRFYLLDYSLFRGRIYKS